MPISDVVKAAFMPSIDLSLLRTPVRYVAGTTPCVSPTWSRRFDHLNSFRSEGREKLTTRFGLVEVALPVTGKVLEHFAAEDENLSGITD